MFILHYSYPSVCTILDLYEFDLYELLFTDHNNGFVRVLAYFWMKFSNFFEKF